MAVSKKDVDLGIAIIDAKLNHIRDDVDAIKDILRGEYIRRGEFAPVKQLVFGLVAVIMLAVVGSIASLVIRK